MSAATEGPEIIGVIHLAPLPGAPRNQSTIPEIIEAALRDALAYQQGGARGLIVENYGDVPFAKDHVEPHTVAAMTLAVRTIVSAASTVRVGVNVLRNDALAAIAIAAIGGASFIRVNVHTGVMVTDQGIIEGRAYETLRYRRLLDQGLQIWADVMVKHATPLDGPTLEEAALDTVRRGLADAVIVTGRSTGEATNPEDVARVRAVLPDTPLYVGSGVTPDLIPQYVPAATGFIVGTWAKYDGRIELPVDPGRVRRLVEAARDAMARGGR